MVVIKWTNKFSGESGFVKGISTKEQHFINTYDQSEAKRYNENTAKGQITNLVKFGEAENNNFEIVEV